MFLCDIGNTSYHFLEADADYRENVNTFNPQTINKTVYFISVNSKINHKLEKLENWINISQFINRDNYYETMGIDRIVACESIENGIIIDAGSAVTVDVVKNSRFVGGFIYPGVKFMQETYANISELLSYSFNFDLELDIIPKNSQDAISYGYLKTLYCEVMSHKMPITITGGDAGEFKKIFKDAKVDERLIFNGMKKIIQKANIC